MNSRLPDHFETELHAMDARLQKLAAHASHASTPMGLADRVFEASANRLPGGSAQLRLVSASGVRREVALHQTRWARIAMAASVAIVAGLALFMMQSKPVAKSTMIALGENTGGLSLLAALDHHRGSTSYHEAEVAYLFDSMGSTSEGLRSDLVHLVTSY